MGAAPSRAHKPVRVPASPRVFEKEGAESLSFEIEDSAVFEAYAAARSLRHFKLTAALRWAIIVAIGCATAVVATAITLATVQLADVKQHVVDGLIEAEARADGVPSGAAFAAFIGLSVAYAAAAAVLVACVEPAAGGSGIPEVKAMLNGVALPHVLRVRALLVKAAGNALSVASGLPVGKEGPMVHSGAILASALSQGANTVCGVGTRWLVHEPFRNDREKRDFVSCGAAAGVAAAFGAPVGGLLFAIEEGTSHWFRSLVWRILLCSVVAAFVVNLLLSGLLRGVGWGALDSPGMLAFGEFGGSAWAIYELPLFLLLGALGGLAGAAFNAVSRALTAWRRAHVPATSRALRVIEVIVVAAVIAVAKFAMSLALGSCMPVPPRPEPEGGGGAALVRLYCEPGQHNDVASLLMAPAEASIKRLFHAPIDAGAGGDDEFPLPHLAAFVGFYLAAATVTYGIAVPSGLFIPALLTGAAMGRAAGAFARVVAPHGSLVDPGVYALIGAAAMLGGTTRMTVSLAVILLECTGNLSYALPLMATLMAARLVGNWFNEGIYDTHITLAGWPVLPETPAGLDAAGARELRVADVMTPSRKLRTLSQVCTVREAAALLGGCRHHAFPVVYADDMLRAHPRLGSLAGLVQRRHVATLLARRAYHAQPPAVPLHAAGIGGGGGGDGTPRANGGVGGAHGVAALLSDVAFTTALGSAGSSAAGDGGGGGGGGGGGAGRRQRRRRRSLPRPGAAAFTGAAVVAGSGGGGGDDGGASSDDSSSGGAAVTGAGAAGGAAGLPRTRSAGSATAVGAPPASAGGSGGGGGGGRGGAPAAAGGPRGGQPPPASAPASAPQRGHGGGGGDDLTFVVVLDSGGGGGGAGRSPSPTQRLSTPVRPARVGASAAVAGLGAAAVGGAAAARASPSVATGGGYVPPLLPQYSPSAASTGSGGGGGGGGASAARAVRLRLPTVPSFHSATGGGSPHGAAAASGGASAGGPQPPPPDAPDAGAGACEGRRHSGLSHAHAHSLSGPQPAAGGGHTPAADAGGRVGGPTAGRRASDASRLRYGGGGGGGAEWGGDAQLGGGALQRPLLRPDGAAAGSRRVSSDARDDDYDAAHREDLAPVAGSGAHSSSSSLFPASRAGRSESGDRAPLLQLSRQQALTTAAATAAAAAAATAHVVAPARRIVPWGAAFAASGGGGSGYGGGSSSRRTASAGRNRSAYGSAGGGGSPQLIRPTSSGRRWRSGGGGGGGGGLSGGRSFTTIESGDATTTTTDAGRGGGRGAPTTEELLYVDEPLLRHEELEASYPHTPLVVGPPGGRRGGGGGGGPSGGGGSAAGPPPPLLPGGYFLDLRPYLNPAPYTVHVHAPLDRAYDLFRSLGLRHLLVVNDAHDVVGVVTRKDLAGPRLADALARKRRRLRRAAGGVSGVGVDGGELERGGGHGWFWWC